MDFVFFDLNLLTKSSQQAEDNLLPITFSQNNINSVIFKIRCYHGAINDDNEIRYELYPDIKISLKSQKNKFYTSSCTYVLDHIEHRFSVEAMQHSGRVEMEVIFSDPETNVSISTLPYFFYVVPSLINPDEIKNYLYELQKFQDEADKIIFNLSTLLNIMQSGSFAPYNDFQNHIQNLTNQLHLTESEKANTAMKSLENVENTIFIEKIKESGYMPDEATEEKAGIVKLATQTMAQAGTDDTTAMTPEKTKLYFDNVNFSWSKITSEKPTTLNGYGITDAYNPNLLINGDFKIWQRGEAFERKSSAYTADRWKCSSSDGTTAGNGIFRHENGLEIRLKFHRIMYTMEDRDFLNILGKKVTLSWSYNGVIQSETIIAENPTIFNKIFQPGVLNWVKLELGEIATPFVPKSYAEELEDCQRYYEKSYNMSALPGAIINRGQIIFPVNGVQRIDHFISFKTRKRIPPTIRIYSAVTGAQGNVSVNSSDLPVTVSSGVGETGFHIYSSTIPTVGNAAFHWEADSEI